MVGLGIIN